MTTHKLLSCGCHRVCRGGFVYSRLVQFSAKGMRGIQTITDNKWRKLSTTKTRHNYLQTAIHGKSWRVNRLVAIAFLPNRNGLPEVQHRNGIRTDNRVVNLKWGNQKTNAEDRHRHGNTARGEDKSNSKLDAKKIIKIRSMIAKQALQSIADEMNVSKKLILLIKQNKIWRHI